MKILVPTVIPITFEAPAGVRDVRYDVAEPIPAEHRDAEAVVLWLNPADRLAAMPAELPRLRWIQGLSAGMDAAEAAGFDPAVTICAGTGLHDVPVAEHALALILAAARRLDQCAEAQSTHTWLRSITGNQTLKRTGFTMVRGARVLIWGFGGIGHTLADYLRAMGADVAGIARTAGERHGYPVHTPADLPQLLPAADVLVNILPATGATHHAVDAAVLAALPEHAWLVNVGRGATVDESALLEALHSGGIAGAALDVFETEPLPQDSPLWEAPNIIITPHSAGGRPQHPGDLIAENLRRDLAGEPKLGVVSRS